MRTSGPSWVLVLGLGWGSGLALSGCRHAAPETKAPPPEAAKLPPRPAGQEADRGRAGDRPPPAGTAPKGQPAKPARNPRFPIFTPIVAAAGRVVSVNGASRFAVVEFTPEPPPPAGRRLEALRQGKWVGSLRVTGPADRFATVADILAGEARPGDQVREPAAQPAPPP